MTLNATDISPNQDCSSSASSVSNECPKNEPTSDSPAAAIADPVQLNRDEKSNDSTIVVGDDEENDDNFTRMEIDCTAAAAAVCPTDDQPEKDEIRSDDDRIVVGKKKKDTTLDSPKKRSKSTPRKSSSSSPSSTKSNSPLIAKPKLQINDKTLKKLRTDTDDLIFEDTSNNSESNSQQPVNHEPSHDSPSAKLKSSNNNCLMPVVNNVLSRSIAAIFKSSPVNKNGEFVNSYSALGFNKGPRVKRVCRTFSDVYRGQPRAVFPAVPTSQKSGKTSKTGSANSSPSKQRKSSKKLLKSSASSSAAQSASTSKSNSNDSTHCSYDCDSDDLEITDYIARNLKREMESKDISV